MRVTLAQLNPIVGDIRGNLARITDVVAEAAADKPDLVVFPELFLTGYPPRDLLLRPAFIKRIREAVTQLTEASVRHPETGILFGTPWPTDKKTGNRLCNAAVLVCRGQRFLAQCKSLLPTYDVFDEARYFDPAPEVDTLVFRGEVLGVSICEDAWNAPELWPRGGAWAFDPVEALARKGATLFINISASPFSVGKPELRYRIIRRHAARYGVPFLYVNQVGANDELIFDGCSLCVDGRGDVTAAFPSFREHVQTVDTSAAGAPEPYQAQEKIESVHDALVLGIRDYMRKCGFSKAVVALSGGIDSAVTCCLAAEAIGPDNIIGVSMPSPYSSQGSVDDAKALADSLGVRLELIPISGILEAYLKALRPSLGARQGVTEENIQARIRGNIVMAFSNRFGYLVLTTGNKSELAVGYCTLYGDMSGGLSVLSDVPKTMVYKLADHINSRSPVIPQAIIEKPPSAELKPGQVDQDTLPPYPVLDQIIQHYVEDQCSADEIIAKGFDPETVRWVIQAIDRNEYKRRQAAPGLKVTSKAFGIGRRMPVAAKYEP